MTDMTDMTEITPPSALPARLRALLAGLCLAPGLALSAGTGHIFLSNKKNDNLTRTPPPPPPLPPGGPPLYVACSDDPRIDVIDVASRKTVDTLSVGEDPELFD